MKELNAEGADIDDYLSAAGLSHWFDRETWEAAMREDGTAGMGIVLDFRSLEESPTEPAPDSPTPRR